MTPDSTYSAPYKAPPRVSGTQAGPSFVDELDPIELIRGLWRRKWAIFWTVSVVVLLTALILSQITPKYSAKAVVMLDARKSNVVNVEEVLSGLDTDDEIVNSEILVIRSRALAAKVIRKLNLASLPEFNPTLPQPSSPLAFLNPATYLSVSDIKRMFGFSREVHVPEEARLERENALVVDTFLSRVDVAREGRSLAISMIVTSESPDLAARAVNALADQYLVEQLEAKFEATERASRWLNERVTDLRDKVIESERAAAEYRAASGLIQSKDGETVIGQQVAEINSQLIISGAQKAEAQARLRQVQSLIQSKGSVSSAAEVLSSPLIAALKEQETEVLRQRADLANNFGSKHPRMQSVNAELRDVRSKIASEVRQIVASLQNEVAVANAREAALRGSLNRIQAQAGTANRAEVKLRALEREAQANRELFETFLARFKETTGQDDIQRPDTRILSIADVPQEPSSPRITLILALAVAVGGILGIVVAMLLEHLDHGFRSGDQIEAQTGFGLLGLVPLLTGRARWTATPERYVVDKPVSSYAEALRTIDTGLLLSDVDVPPRSVLVTSSIPREGKSTITLSLGRLLASSGRKVIVVDGDLRRPRVVRALELDSTLGVVDVVSGQTELADAIQVDEQTGLHVLGAGSSAPSPTELFASESMTALIRRLEDMYDLVLIDSAPVLVVSDSRILARKVDKCLFVVRWASTRRQSVLNGLKQLADADAAVAGVVLSAVNVKEHARYGYGDSGYYYGSARRYYAN